MILRRIAGAAFASLLLSASLAFTSFPARQLPQYNYFNHARTDWALPVHYDAFLHALEVSSVLNIGRDGFFFDTGLKYPSYEAGAAVAELFRKLYPSDDIQVVCNYGWDRIKLRSADEHGGGVYDYYGDNPSNCGRIYACWKPGSDPAASIRKMRAVEQAVSSVISQAPAGTYEKCLFYHDWIADRVTYDYSKSSHDIYSAVIDGRSVCDGYTYTFLLLCFRSGVTASSASVSTNGDSSSEPDHNRDAVFLNGSWNLIDITWDDVGDVRTYDWFMVPGNDFWQNFLNAPFLVFT